MSDGRLVGVTLNFEGNIYSEWRNRLYIRIGPRLPNEDATLSGSLQGDRLWLGPA